MLRASPALFVWRLWWEEEEEEGRKAGLGWEAPDTVPSAGGNRLFRELVTPSVPPLSPLAASRDSRDKIRALPPLWVARGG